MFVHDVQDSHLRPFNHQLHTSTKHFEAISTIANTESLIYGLHS